MSHHVKVMDEQRARIAELEEGQRRGHKMRDQFKQRIAELEAANTRLGIRIAELEADVAEAKGYALKAHAKGWNDHAKISLDTGRSPDDIARIAELEAERDTWKQSAQGLELAVTEAEAERDRLAAVAPPAEERT